METPQKYGKVTKNQKQNIKTDHLTILKRDVDTLSA